MRLNDKLCKRRLLVVNVGKNKIMGVVSQYEMKYLSKNEWREFV